MEQLSLYDQIGGEAAINGLVDAFYRNMESFAVAADVRAMHEADLSPMHDVLRMYLTEWLGGPKTYSASRGHPKLRMRHLPFKIGQAERDAWMACMEPALADTIADPAHRQEIQTGLAKLADWMRNQMPPQG